MKDYIITFLDPNGYECTERVIAKSKDEAWWNFIKNYSEICIISVKAA